MRARFSSLTATWRPARFLYDWLAFALFALVALLHPPCSSDITYFFLPSAHALLHGDLAQVYTVHAFASLDVTPPLGILFFVPPTLFNFAGPSVCKTSDVAISGYLTLVLEQLALLWLWAMLLSRFSECRWTKGQFILWIGLSAPGMMTFFWYGHIEQIAAGICVTLALLAMQQESWNKAAFWLCIAPLVKTSVLPLSLALLVWMLVRGLLPAVWKGIAVGLIVDSVAALPLFIANPQAMLRALVFFHLHWGIHAFALWRFVPLFPDGELLITVGGAVTLGFFGARLRWSPLLIIFLADTVTMLGLKEWFPYYPTLWMAWLALLWPSLSMPRWSYWAVFLSWFIAAKLFVFIALHDNSAHSPLVIIGSVLVVALLIVSAIATILRVVMLKKQDMPPIATMIAVGSDVTERASTARIPME